MITNICSKQPKTVLGEEFKPAEGFLSRYKENLPD